MHAHLRPEAEHGFQGCIFTISQRWPTDSAFTQDIGQRQLTNTPNPFYERGAQLFHPIPLVEPYTPDKNYPLSYNTNNIFRYQRKFLKTIAVEKFITRAFKQKVPALHSLLHLTPPDRSPA